jgi:hypothetical protein
MDSHVMEQRGTLHDETILPKSLIVTQISDGGASG